MRRLVTAAEMRAMDHEAIHTHGISSQTLMENAGRGVADLILETFHDLEDARVVVLAGKGNNGGDGFITARHLKRSELRPLVILVGAKPDELRGDASWAYRQWVDASGETSSVLTAAEWEAMTDELEGADLIVDALLGTGAQGPLEGLFASVVESLEDLPAPIIAVDIPTGVNADTGAVAGPCVHADLTVTFALPKLGHLLYPGRGVTGPLHWVDIGIPAEVLDAGDGRRAYAMESTDVLLRLPDRHPEMHKGDRGRLLIVGGSAGLTGAVALAANAAVRAGAGLVTAGVPLSLHDILETKLTEAMTLPLPELEVRSLSRDAFDTIALYQPGRLTAMAVGPGMGRHPSTQKLTRRLVSELDLPMVLDADGLHAYAGQPDLLRMKESRSRLVITPHVGEFAALTGESPDAILADRLGMAARWAERLGVVVVLKGAPTVIGDPDSGTVYVNTTGSESLATGGTGDVLTGMIAGFMAQGVEALDAAILAVYLHGYTADYIGEDWGSGFGLRASDLVDYLPLALGWMISPFLEDEEIE